VIIDVWSDVVCPWCFIGKRRLEKALTQFGHKDEIVIRHRAFQLQPDAGETIPTIKLLAEKYHVSPDQVKEMQANVCAVADGEGLCYNLDDTLSGNTFDAHRLLLWAATIGKEQELLEAMYSSYFEKSLPLFAHQDLVAVAQSVGISPVDAMNILESDQYITAVNEDRELASRLGATGVPFFVIDMKYGISGAQPLEAFVETLNAAWEERSPN
jgi:predicted DsbA family dithiol-disulfide isomerase